MDIVKQFTTNKAHTNVGIRETTDGLLFRASDIGKALEIENITTLLHNLEYSEKQETFLTEKGVYKIIVESQSPVAEQVRIWVSDTINDIRVKGKKETIPSFYLYN